MNADLWAAIYELYILLLSREKKEAKFQEFFERNPIVFSVLGFPKFASYEKSSGNKLPYDFENKTQREPDFICGNPETQEVTIFELKTPIDNSVITSRTDGQRAKFKAVFESYISQVTEYIEFITSNLDARNEVAKTLDLGAVKTVSGILVYGLTSGDEEPIISKLIATRKHHIKVLSFEQVLSEMVGTLSIGRKDILTPNLSGKTQHLKGLLVVLHIVILKQQNAKSYIFDIGSTTGCRVSIYILDGHGTIELVDRKGRSSYFDWEVKYNSPMHIRLEISNEQNFGFVLVSIDNREVALSTSLQGFDVEPDLKSMVVGADLSGRMCGRFGLLEEYCVDRTMTLSERIESFEYFTRKVTLNECCIKFTGTSFMRRGKKGLVQDDNGKRPVYCKSIKYLDLD